MWIDDDLIFDLCNKTFGQMVDEGYELPKDVIFYNEANRDTFHKKFYQHFKYNCIAYPSKEMFTDMYKDILMLNYPKYKHYYDILEKAKTLKWWNNKDFITTFERTLNSTDTKDFTTSLEKIENVIRNLNKTGTVEDAYSRTLQEKTVEKGRIDTTNEMQKSGSNTKTVDKGTSVTTDFTRNLTSTEHQQNQTEKENTSTNTNSGTSTSSNESSSEDITNNTTKNLDTPQGTINNLIDNVNAYMTTATVDSNRDTNKTNSSSKSENTGTSTDTTTGTDTENKHTDSSEAGTTKNIEATTGTDTTTDTLGEKHETIASDVKANDITLDKTGSATDTKTYNTTDAVNKDTTGSDTTKGNEKVIGLDDENYTKKEEGNIGVTSAGQLVNDWIKFGYINIDKMIIRDCEKLFLQVY